MPTEINAFIIGGMKCGTTSLAGVLGAHPLICLSRPKETHLFDYPRVQTGGIEPADIDKHFGHANGQPVVLDATPAYVFMPGSIDAILRYNPNAKLILVLRSPIDRAISHFGHEVHRGTEKLPFLLALCLEPLRLRRDRKNPLLRKSAYRQKSYVSRGLYFGQIRSLLAKTSNVHVVSFRELIVNTERTLVGIYRFLDIEPNQTPSSLPKRNSKAPTRKYPFVRWLLKLRFLRDARKTEALLGWPRGSLI
jgi:hypothetical protein